MNLRATTFATKKLKRVKTLWGSRKNNLIFPSQYWKLFRIFGTQILFSVIRDKNNKR